MEASFIFVLAASLAGVAAAAPAAAGSICHVLTYSGECGNLTSLSTDSGNSSAAASSSAPSSSDACTYAAICLVPTICNSTELTNSIDALTGDALVSGAGNSTLPANTTGCVSFSDFGMQLDSLAVCDGNRYLINGTDSAYRCICNDLPNSCPEQGPAVSVSYANGTSSTSAGSPSGQPLQFSWTWGASSASTTPTARASTGMDASASTIPARTTFTFTFGGGSGTSTASSPSTPTATGGIGSAQQGNQNDPVTGFGNSLSVGLTMLAAAVAISVGTLQL